MRYIRGSEIKQDEMAEDFYEAYIRCLTPDDNRIVSIPAFVNGFFACELYLKCILKENKTESTGHDIEVLFHQLPLTLQENIKEIFIDNAKEFLSLHNISFDELINKIAYGFEFWRYIYEDNNKTFEDKYPFAYSENFLKYFLPILVDISKQYKK